MTTAILSILGGLAILVVGGELLVRGASRIAALAGISPLVIGLTVVAFGTSSPELAVSLKASFNGQTDIAIGNVVGSNIFNVLFILGVSALVTPLVVSSQLIRVDVPIMIFASVALLVLGFDGSIGRIDGIGLFLGLICYTGWSIHQSRKETTAGQQKFEQDSAGTPKRTSRQMVLQIGLILVGLLLLTLGARWLVDGSVTIAKLAATNESVSRTMGGIMLGFVVPLTVVTLLVGVARSVKPATAQGRR